MDGLEQIREMLVAINTSLQDIQKEFVRRNCLAEKTQKQFWQREERRKKEREELERQRQKNRQESMQLAQEMYEQLLAKHPSPVNFKQGMVCPRCGQPGIVPGAPDTDMAYCDSCKQWSSITEPDPQNLPELPEPNERG